MCKFFIYIKNHFIIFIKLGLECPVIRIFIFIFLVNYFRDHIKDHLKNTRPLQEVIKFGNKTKKVRQTNHKYIQEALAADESFIIIKKMINNCPKLFFIDDKLPIFIYTQMHLIML
jgi:hypothetical protein